MLYELLKDGVLTGRREHHDKAPDPNPVKGFEWLPVQSENQPTYNDKTHKVETTPEIVSGTVIDRKTVVALKPEEIANAKRRNQQAAISDLPNAISDFVDANKATLTIPASMQAFIDKVK